MTEIKHDQSIEVEETSLAIDCLQSLGEGWRSNFCFLKDKCTAFLSRKNMMGMLSYLPKKKKMKYSRLFFTSFSLSSESI